MRPTRPAKKSRLSEGTLFLLVAGMVSLCVCPSGCTLWFLLDMLQEKENEAATVTSTTYLGEDVDDFDVAADLSVVATLLERRVKFWGASGSHRKTVKLRERGYSVSLSPKGRRALVLSEHKKVEARVISVKTGKVLKKHKLKQRPSQMLWMKSGKALLHVDGVEVPKLFASYKSKNAKSLPVPKLEGAKVLGGDSCSSDGEALLVCAWRLDPLEVGLANVVVAAYDIRKKRWIGKLRDGDRDSDEVSVTSTATNGASVAIAEEHHLTHQHTVRVLQIHSGESVHEPREYLTEITQLSFSPDGLMLSGGDGAGSRHLIWDMQNGKETFISGSLEGKGRWFDGLGKERYLLIQRGEDLLLWEVLQRRSGLKLEQLRHLPTQ